MGRLGNGAWCSHDTWDSEVTTAARYMGQLGYIVLQRYMGQLGYIVLQRCMGQQGHMVDNIDEALWLATTVDTTC